MSVLRNEKPLFSRKSQVILVIIGVLLASVILAVTSWWQLYAEEFLHNNPGPRYILIAVFVAIAVASWIHPIGQLREKCAAHINMMFYFLFLSFVLTAVVAYIAIRIGAIDRGNGQFVGDYGQYLEKALHFLTKIDDGFYAACLILIVTLVPQLLTYFVAGIFQCASRILYASEIIEFSFWLAVKPFITVSGVILATSVVIYSSGLPNFELTTLLKSAVISAVAVFSAFWLVWIYEEIKRLILKETSLALRRATSAHDDASQDGELIPTCINQNSCAH